jgi:hypothetical protein
MGADVSLPLDSDAAYVKLSRIFSSSADIAGADGVSVSEWLV